MFRCSECGSEYSEKPDFCECGNDIFIEIMPESGNKAKTNIKIPSLKINKSEFLSWVVFLFFILASVLVLLFFPKISNNQNQLTPEPVQQEKIKPQNNIPPIDSFWIDCKPQVEDENVVEQIKEFVFKPKAEPKNEQPKQQKVQQTQKLAAKSTQASKPAAKPAQQQKPKVSQTTMPTTGKPQRKMMSYEVVNYRTALRQRLLSNLDIYKVQGSGKCGITFAIDENGKLINRNFLYQSDNKSVNDEIYNMLMRTPRFNPPPEALVNKVIKMSFYLNGESYEINFID